MMYSQINDIAQKKATSTAASVLDSSSQSKSLQRKADMANIAAQRAEAPRPNNTGMPDNLKAGIESLSGFSMDNVRVHYNSSKPATVQALAYTQGTDIHVAPGQEKCLPHEAWHVAQQMAGRVSPTTNINGMPVNDNAALEHEADVMGEKALQCKKQNCVTHYSVVNPSTIQKRGELCCNCNIAYRKKGAKGASSEANGNGFNGNIADGTVVNYFEWWGLYNLASIQPITGGNAPGHCAEPQSVYQALREIITKNNSPENIDIKNIEISGAVITNDGFNAVQGYYNRIVEKKKGGGVVFNIKEYNNVMREIGPLYEHILHHLLVRNNIIKNDKTKNAYPRCATCSQWVPGKKVLSKYLLKNK